MTPKELKAIENRCLKASSAPWVDDGYRIHLSEKYGKVLFEYKYSENFGTYDGEFISHSRSDIPKLLDYVKHLERCLSMASDEYDAMKEHLETQIKEKNTSSMMVLASAMKKLCPDLVDQLIARVAEYNKKQDAQLEEILVWLREDKTSAHISSSGNPE